MAKKQTVYRIETVFRTGEVLVEEITPGGGVIFCSDPALAERASAIMLYQLARLPVPERLTNPAAIREAA